MITQHKIRIKSFVNQRKLLCYCVNLNSSSGHGVKNKGIHEHHFLISGRHIIGMNLSKYLLERIHVSLVL